MKLYKFFKEKWLLIFGIVLSTLMLASCGGSFSVANLKKIELGTTQDEVEKKLGKPHDINDVYGEKWYYYSNNFKKKYDKVIDLLENGKTEADFEKADKLYTEMEKMTYKCTLIKFNNGKEVTEVFYDAKHKYEESNDYATTEKTLKEVKLSISDIQYYVDESQDESSIKFTNANSSTSYEASFSDGSYIHSYASDIKTTLEGNSAVVTWKDKISEYKVNKKANKIGTLKEDGTFNLEYAKGDLALPYGITEITDEMFLNNTELTSIEIPNSVKSIGKKAFQGCSSLTSIVIPDSVTSIGSYAFYNCSSLTSVVISSSVTSIEDEAFKDCKLLKRVTIEKGSQLTHIGKKVFKNTSVSFETLDGGNYLSCGDNKRFALISIDGNNGLQDFIIKSSTKVIADDVLDNFQGTITFEDYGMKFKKTDDGFELTELSNTSISNLVIPNFITSVKKGVLANCTQLESLTLPFVGASRDATDESACFGYIFGASSSNDSSYVPSSLKEIIITAATSIGGTAFYNCSSLTSIVIPNSVTSIGYYAFLGCSSLTSVTFEEGSKLTSIGDSAFDSCSSLTSIVIPNSVTSIGYKAFNSCSSLTSIVIPNSVTSIEYWAFDNCNSLTIYCETSSAPSGWSSNWHLPDIPVYWGVTQDDIIYQTGLQLLIIDGEAVVTGHEANITNVIIPSTITINRTTYSVTSIGSYAFECCSSLTTIVIPNSVTSIGNSAFYNCSSLTSVTFEENSKLTRIGSSAFSGCSSLTSIVIPNSVTSIGSHAFGSRVSLVIYCEAESQPSGWSSNWGYTNRPVYWGINKNNHLVKDGIIYVIKNGEAVVTGHEANITNVIIPLTITINRTTYSVTSIGEYAFHGCSSLASVTFEEGSKLTYIKSYAFCYCSSLTTIVIPNSVTSIGEYAFFHCSSLTSVTFEENSKLTNIAPYAFSECDLLQYKEYGNCLYLGNEVNPYLVLVKAKDTSITEATISNNTRIIGYSAFSGCSSLTTIVIPNSVTSIEKLAFSGCSSLTIYCEASSRSSGWKAYWNSSDRPVYWAGQWSYVNGVPTPNK